MFAYLHQPHLLRPQVAHHSFRIADRPQGPSKDQPVEATQLSRNLFPMFRDKILHGVSVPPKIWRSCRTTTSYRERKRLLRLVAALPRCDATQECVAEPLPMLCFDVIGDLHSNLAALGSERYGMPLLNLRMLRCIGYLCGILTHLR